MKTPHTSKRPPQVEIPLSVIHERTREYMQTTPHSIRNVNDILWSFPEKLAEKRNQGDGWKWSQVKKGISDYMNSEKMNTAWRLSSPAHEGAVKLWTRIPATTATTAEEVRA